jgi:hypothetical protein
MHMQIQQAQQFNWAEHIAQWRAGKLTRSEYCRQHDLKFHTFIYQIKRHQKAQVKPITLVPVKVRPALASRNLVLQGPKGWSLALEPDVSASWLAELMGRLA